VHHGQRRDLVGWGGAIAAAAALAVSWPTVAGVFLFDDAPVVRDNALVAAGRIGAFFGSSVFGGSDGDLLFRPLWLLSLWFDRALFGAHAAPMHAVNVALHAAAAALLYRVARRLVDEPRRALACALVFAVHPVHLDAVAFLTNRSELLALVFVLFAVDALLYDPAWRAWLRGEAPPARHAATPARLSARAVAVDLAAAAALFAALLCKETAAGALAALAVVVMLRAAQRLRPPPSVLIGLGAFALAFAAYLALRRHALGDVGGDSAAAWVAGGLAGVIVGSETKTHAYSLVLVELPDALPVDYSDFALST